MQNHQLINSDSGNQEYYTPQEIIEAARKTMGSIDLDPFSSETANRRVLAKRFFTEQDNGFEQDWFGNVWMNHPFSRENNKNIYPKIQEQLVNIDNLCMISFAATSEKWFHPLLQYPQCYLKGRTNYYLPDGTLKKGVSKGSVVTYIGNDVESFYTHFHHLGEIKVRYK